MNVDEDRSGKGTRESNGGWKMRKIYKYESIMKDYVINKKQQEILSCTKSDAFQDTVRIFHDLICLVLSVSLSVSLSDTCLLPAWFYSFQCGGGKVAFLGDIRQFQAEEPKGANDLSFYPKDLL